MKPRRILVCEDEDAIRDFVVIHLKRSGYEVYDVNCGEKAIEAWNRGLRFDVGKRKGFGLIIFNVEAVPARFADTSPATSR